MIRKACTVLLAAASMAPWALIPPASATVPRADVPQAYVGRLVASWDGAQLKAAWPVTAFGSQACPAVAPGAVRTGSAGNLSLFTTGADGNCAAIETARAWHTGVFEVRLYLPGVNGKIADWPAFWFTASPWPLSGEIDAFEGIRGTSQAHYHYGTYTARLSKGTSDGSLPVYSPRIGPGWHTLDLVWSPSSARVYYDGHLFTVMSGPWFRPGMLHMVLDTTEGWCSPAVFCGGPRLAAPMVVRYVRVWTYR